MQSYDSYDCLKKGLGVSDGRFGIFISMDLSENLSH
jgi:hypothetical protein